MGFVFMLKYAFAGLLIIGAYFVFFNGSYPGTVEFQNHSLSSKQDNNDTIDKDIDIFSYRDKSNHHILIFAVKNDSKASLTDLSGLYLGNFKRQGFTFQKYGKRHLGLKSDEAIYMTETQSFEGIIIYIEKGGSPMPQKVTDGADVFNDLESFSF
ncbi:hypothetical protein MNBD_GAMMA09-1175 [hydrothermal vent metagenome]|uniref:Uncharacterized protein n=1 Tax=hydrothermal vent metagenome TaxID=652676 RepID=A0A3B0Y1M5_9ZZZZ